MTGNRDGNQSRKSASVASVKSVSTRDMTSLDDITHNITGDLNTRQYFIKKYGQCFEDGVRYTA